MRTKSILAVVVLLVITGALGLCRRGIEKVTDGVYVATGYGIANSIMIEGDDGLVIMATLTNRAMHGLVRPAQAQAAL